MEELLGKIGWSKAEFAKRAGVSYKTVLNWRTNPPRLAIMYLETVARLIGGRDGD